LKNRSPVIHTN
jgi:hypothetical protein